MQHDKHAVYTFMKHILQDLISKGHVQEGSDIHIFSDGAASQFKQRFNIAAIELLNKDFNVSITWIYFASYHGKGAVDGVGGTLKQLAAIENKKNGSIQNASSFRDILQPKTSINIKFVSREVISETKKETEATFNSTKTIRGTRKIHWLKFVGDAKIMYKTHFECTSFTVSKLW